jgi:hypothetical protein
MAIHRDSRLHPIAVEYRAQPSIMDHRSYVESHGRSQARVGMRKPLPHLSEPNWLEDTMPYSSG